MYFLHSPEQGEVHCAWGGKPFVANELNQIQITIFEKFTDFTETTKHSMDYTRARRGSDTDCVDINIVFHKTANPEPNL